MEQTNWDRRLLELAKHVGDWSKDPKAKVGAVLKNDRNHVVAIGYNGFPINVLDDPELLNDSEIKNDMVVHAEENAILIAGRAAKDGTIYVVGKPVCSRCAGVIIQTGITRVVAASPKESTNSKWDKSGLIAKKMFAQAGIEFVSSGTIKK